MIGPPRAGSAGPRVREVDYPDGVRWSWAVIAAVLAVACVAPPAGAHEAPNYTPTFSVSPNPASVDQPVTLDATGSGSAVDRYYWDFDGNGSFEPMPEGPRVTTSFSRPGTHTVSLRAVDYDGHHSDDVSRTVTVQEPPPGSNPVAGPEVKVTLPPERRGLGALLSIRAWNAGSTVGSIYVEVFNSDGLVRSLRITPPQDYFQTYPLMRLQRTGRWRLRITESGWNYDHPFTVVAPPPVFRAPPRPVVRSCGAVSDHQVSIRAFRVSCASARRIVRSLRCINSCRRYVSRRFSCKSRRVGYDAAFIRCRRGRRAVSWNSVG